MANRQNRRAAARHGKKNNIVSVPVRKRTEKPEKPARDEMRPDIPAFVKTGDTDPRVDTGGRKKGLFDGKPVGRIQLARFTYDAWLKCHPGSDMGQYLKYHKPHDFLGYVGGMLTQAMGQKYPDGGMFISGALIDDAYFEWLGGREDSSALRSEYCRECGPDAEGRCAEAGLADTEHLYGIPVTVSSGTVPEAPFDAAAADEVARYMESVIAGADFAVCCLPVLIPEAVFRGEAEGIESLAHEAACGVKLSPEDYAGYLKHDGSENGGAYFIPLLIRERHPNAMVTAWDAFSAMNPDIALEAKDGDGYAPELIGRYPRLVGWTGEGLAKAGRGGVVPFMESDACDALKEVLGGIEFEVKGVAINGKG